MRDIKAKTTKAVIPNINRYFLSENVFCNALIISFIMGLVGGIVVAGRIISILWIIPKRLRGIFVKILILGWQNILTNLFWS